MAGYLIQWLLKQYNSYLINIFVEKIISCDKGKIRTILFDIHLITVWLVFVLFELIFPHPWYQGSLRIQFFYLNL
jgi:hypothetical protein